MDRSDSSITFSSQPLQTFTFCCLISMDHKGSVSLLISSLGVNRLFHMSVSSYPTTKTPQRPIQQLHMIPLRDWTQIQGRINQDNVFYYLVSLSQKPQSSHKCSKYSLFRMEQIVHSSFQDPQVITHELPHNHSRNP